MEITIKISESEFERLASAIPGVRDYLAAKAVVPAPQQEPDSAPQGDTVAPQRVEPEATGDSKMAGKEWKIFVVRRQGDGHHCITEGTMRNGIGEAELYPTDPDPSVVQFVCLKDHTVDKNSFGLRRWYYIYEQAVMEANTLNSQKKQKQ